MSGALVSVNVVPVVCDGKKGGTEAQDPERKEDFGKERAARDVSGALIS